MIKRKIEEEPNESIKKIHRESISEEGFAGFGKRSDLNRKSRAKEVRTEAKRNTLSQDHFLFLPKENQINAFFSSPIPSLFSGSRSDTGSNGKLGSGSHFSGILMEYHLRVLVGAPVGVIGHHP